MDEIKNKKAMYSIIGIALLLISLVGVTYAFFNYTRTGAANNFSTGRIYFNSTQDGRLQLTNIFPVKASEVDASTLDSVTVNVLGDTTYTDGEEFQVTLVDVENTVNGKKIPINYIATYTANTDAVIGTSSSDYWNARNNKDASIYTLESTGSVEEGKQVLVGYIDNGATGINGTLTIKAYIDKDRIAITDTPEENSEWQQGRTVLTTTEWNSFQNSGTPISFKIKAESNEGIWVEEPEQGTIESCPGCKFIYTTTLMYTTWNMLGWDDANSSVLTSGLYENYQELIATTGKNYFLGVKLNNNNEVTNAYACGVKDGTPFCIEGTVDGSKYADNQALLQGANLWNNTCNVGPLQTGPDTYDDTQSQTLCGDINSGSLSARAGSIGIVAAGVGFGDGCSVAPVGTFGCFGSEAVEPGPSEPGGGDVPNHS